MFYYKNVIRLSEDELLLTKKAEKHQALKKIAVVIKKEWWRTKPPQFCVIIME
jgi:hypothetical protein